MNISNIIQNVATGSAVVLGITYIIGGLIVNLNLARRGIVEFQIVKVKYLVTGIVFIITSIGMLIISFVASITLVVYGLSSSWFDAFMLVSIVSDLSFILTWFRLPSNSKSFFASIYFWGIASTFSFIFPILVTIRYTILHQPVDVFGIIHIGEAILIAVLALIGQIYHYAVFYYGRPSSLIGALDPIGMGIPTCIRMSFTPESARLVKSLGVKLDKQYVTQELYLIDETDHNFIVAFEAFPSDQKETGTLKIDKSIVKAMLFLSK
jgi:hypothetical protein